jgi:two-component system, NarL family, response regulator NreC
MKKLQIFLADDHVSLREGLKMLVNSQEDMEVIGQADNGRTLLQLIKDAKPDLVLIDVSMPEMNGAQTTERLVKIYPNLRILALTRHNDQGYLRQMLRAGASGYVLKQAAAETLLEAIRAVASGGVYIDPTLAGRVVETYVGQTLSRKQLQTSELTEKELEVMRLIAWGHSNKEIAAHLGISTKTVEYHKARSMEKLELRGRPDIIRYALQQGWLQED